MIAIGSMPIVTRSDSSYAIQLAIAARSSYS